jgi:Amidase
MVPASLAGLPVTTIPAGTGGPDDLPMGLQLMGRRGGDAKLLALPPRPVVECDGGMLCSPVAHELVGEGQTGPRKIECLKCYFFLCWLASWATSSKCLSTKAKRLAESVVPQKSTVPTRSMTGRDVNSAFPDCPVHDCFADTAFRTGVVN